MKYFTSDQHFGDKRIGVDGALDLFYRRNSFSSVKEQNEKLLFYMNKVIGENPLVHLGDVCVDVDSLRVLDGLKSKHRTLIVGNYDVDKLSELSLYFDEIYDFGWFEIAGVPHPVYCNHYPVNCKEYLGVADNEKITLCGHIHGLWQVQRGILNVGCDAWHYHPIGEDEIAFKYNAMLHHYDNNVFL